MVRNTSIIFVVTEYVLDEPRKIRCMVLGSRAGPEGKAWLKSVFTLLMIVLIFEFLNPQCHLEKHHTR